MPACVSGRLGMIKMHVVQIETSVNPIVQCGCTSLFHAEMDAPLGGTRMQSIRGCGTLRHTIASLIGSNKIICTLCNTFEMFPERHPTNTMADCDSRNGTMSNQNFIGKKNFSELLLICQIHQNFLLPKFSPIATICCK